MRFFQELNPVASHVAVAALAIAMWVFLIVPLWRRSRPRLVLLSKNQSLKRRLAGATIVLLVFAGGLWTGWHKDAVSARLSRWSSEFTRVVPSPSPSPATLTRTESPVEAVAPTPESWPSLADQLLREGVELRDGGDLTRASERLQEALDSEPNNAAVLAELAKTYDLMQRHDRANEVWRKLHAMGPSVGAAYELADRRLKLGAPFPVATAIPTPPDSSSREVNASPDATAPDFAEHAMTLREHEIDQVSPLPTSTASEISSPPTGATPAEVGPSAETAVAQPGGRLIVLRAPSFGWNLALNLKIDGRTAANIVQGRRYDDFVPAGRHMLTVSAVPNYQPTSTVLVVESGQTYVFTATRGQNTDSVVLVPSALPRGEP
ncbi:MAG TPA: tetratricopeptide repeat protein [Candidatus Udaeobacter sp.]|nr:tetratricopeptide repeat protein [Candidatus Udaeobacter sp.]